MLLPHNKQARRFPEAGLPYASEKASDLSLSMVTDNFLIYCSVLAFLRFCPEKDKANNKLYHKEFSHRGNRVGVSLFLWTEILREAQEISIRVLHQPFLPQLAQNR